MGANNKKAVRELLLILNNASEKYKIEYKVCYYYKYIPKLNDITVQRKMIKFSGTVPIKNFHPKTDQDLIEMILDELDKF